MIRRLKVAIRPARRIRNAEGLRVCSFCHEKRCRRARPMCRAMRLVKPNQRPCTCGGGCHHSHRVGGHPLCEHHPNHAESAWENMTKRQRIGA